MFVLPPGQQADGAEGATHRKLFPQAEFGDAADSDCVEVCDAAASFAGQSKNFQASSCSATPPRLVTLRMFYGERIMLTGADLLSKVKELGDVSKSELVRSCGYVSTKKDGTERLNFTAFYEALLEAKGVNLAEHGSGKGKAGRKLSYVATVQGNGNLLVGKAYTALLDLNPGDEFEIKLGRKQIRLVPAGSAEEE